MFRLQNWLIFAAGGLSLAIVLLLPVLYVVGSEPIWLDASCSRYIQANRGKLMLGRSYDVQLPTTQALRQHDVIIPGVSHIKMWQTNRKAPPQLYRYDEVVSIALWLPLAVLSIPICLASKRLYCVVRSNRWKRVGRCEECGYDLRASPNPSTTQLDRCPECRHSKGA